MKKNLLFLPALFLFSLSCKNEEKKAGKNPADESPVNNAIVITKTRSGEPDTVKKSIHAYAENKIGAARFTISYYSPAVRNRIIWGGLVPYGQVWVTGAHRATSIETDKNFYIDGKPLPAGKYGLFTIPGKDEWTVILNSNWDQHLADEYDEKEDMLRLKVKPDSLDYVQERLMYDINQRSQKEGDILVMWEKLRIKVPVRIAD